MPTGNPQKRFCSHETLRLTADKRTSFSANFLRQPLLPANYTPCKTRKYLNMQVKDIEETKMGKVVEKVKLTSLFEPEKSVEVDAIIDTGATMVVLPQDVIEELGLRKIGERRVRYANNQIQIKSVYRGVILELKGRDGIFDVLGEVEGSEPLVGQIVLEALDLIVDPITKTVIPNPRSPDMPMTEILMATAYNSAVRYCSPKPLRASHTRRTLSEMPTVALESKDLKFKIKTK